MNNVADMRIYYKCIDYIDMMSKYKRERLLIHYANSRRAYEQLKERIKSTDLIENLNDLESRIK